MAASLTALDLFFILCYIFLLILLGYISASKETREDFLIAGRSLGTFANTATIVASKSGTGALVTFVALVYLYGISAMWFFAGASTGYIIFIFFAVNLRKISSDKEFYTLSDYFFDKFGKTTGFISAGIVLVYMLLASLLQLIGGAKILAFVSGISFTVSLFIIGATILIYTILGGFRAVVKTDIAQLLSLIVLMGFLGYIISPGSIDIPPSASLSAAKTAPLKSIISFFIIGIILPFASAELWQRVYAARDVQTVRRSLIASALVYQFIGILLLIIGLVISPQLSGIDPDMVLIEGFTTLLPPGFTGLAIVVFLAAVMSSADSYLFVNISVLLQDFYARLRPLKKTGLVKLFRYTLIIFLAICLLLSFWLRSMVAITFIVLAFSSVIALAGMAAWMMKKITAPTIIGGMVTGFVGTLVIALTSPIAETLILNAFSFTLFGFFAGSLLHWLYEKKQN